MSEHPAAGHIVTGQRHALIPSHAWLAGSGALLWGACAPWSHATLPLLGSVTRTGLDLLGPAIPLLALSTGACAMLEVSHRTSRLARLTGMLTALAASALVINELALGVVPLAGLNAARMSADPLTRDVAQVTSAGFGYGLGLAVIGAALATSASLISWRCSRSSV